MVWLISFHLLFAWSLVLHVSLVSLSLPFPLTRTGSRELESGEPATLAASAARETKGRPSCRGLWMAEIEEAAARPSMTHETGEFSYISRPPTKPHGRLEEAAMSLDLGTQD